MNKELTKPYEIGDWVIFKDATRHKITKIEPLKYIFDNTFECGIYTETVLNMRLWKPQIGEWCWFYKEDAYSSVQYTLAKFVSSDADTSIIPLYTYQVDKYSTLCSSCCEPFIGTLPTHLQQPE